MPHINTEPGQHDHTVSAYIIKRNPDSLEETPKLLVHMHKKFNKLLQPGGHIELNESPWAAIAHELVEETGYQFSQLEVVQPVHLAFGLNDTNMVLHPTPFVYNTHPTDSEGNHYHTDVTFLFLTTEFPEGEPGEGETTDLRWLTLEEIQEDKDKIIGSGVKAISEVAFEILKDPSWKSYPTNTFK